MSASCADTMARALCAVLLVCVAAASAATLHARALNNRPVIGVLSQEVSPTVAGIYGNHSSYIAASYVKFLEGAGARVVPIIYAIVIARKETFEHSIGLMTLVYTCAKLNARGDYFPLWGTCLGFELITYLAAGRREHRAWCDSENEMLPLDFKPDFAESRLFKSASKEVIKILSTENVTPNFHHWCITEQNMTKFGLSEDWRVMSTNKDSDGFEFVSTIESRSRPFYATMFHPEKIGYEWKEKHRTPHDAHAVLTMQYFADFFVDEARKSSHKFSPNGEIELIYQYQPTYTGNRTIYQQLYFFNY
ncbi:Folate gamma-glutamyl hydrolase [Gryllus bimaculatus]|nr:Folate gamma-glutamyl hydrolase [Gryllus bimaculatus]